jgi:hypothetical protein
LYQKLYFIIYLFFWGEKFKMPEDAFFLSFQNQRWGKYHKNIMLFLTTDFFIGSTTDHGNKRIGVVVYFF